jgi:hypothetical protein
MEQYTVYSASVQQIAVKSGKVIVYTGTIARPPVAALEQLVASTTFQSVPPHVLIQQFAEQ